MEIYQNEDEVLDEPIPFIGGLYVLAASLIINEYRSILENLVEAGWDVPQVLVKGLEVASKKIENFNENE